MFDTDAAIPFTLNGRAVAVAAPAEWRLSRVLRDELGLPGTKIGCDAGDCGGRNQSMYGGVSGCGGEVSGGFFHDGFGETAKLLPQNCKYKRYIG